MPSVWILLPLISSLKTCFKSHSNFITACLFEGCLNQSYFLDNRLDPHSNTKIPAASALSKASKNGSKKSSLKALKKKAAKATKESS